MFVNGSKWKKKFPVEETESVMEGQRCAGEGLIMCLLFLRSIA